MAVWAALWVMAACAGGGQKGDAGAMGESGGPEKGAAETARPTPTPAPTPVVRPVSEAVVITSRMTGELVGTEGMQLGIERVVDGVFRDFRLKRVALITNEAAVDKRGMHTIEHFIEAGKFTFVRVFLIEDDPANPSAILADLLAGRTSPEAIALTPEEPEISDAMLEDIELLVFDAALEGPRFGLDFYVMMRAQEQAALHNLEYVVLDRPLLCDNSLVSGVVGESQYIGTRASYLPLPVYPGMTPGEAARLLNRHFGMQANLKVVEMTGWARADGNGWMSALPEDKITSDGRAMLAALRARPYMAPGGAELLGALQLTDPALWKSHTLRIGAEGRAELVVETAEVATMTFLERMGSLDAVGVDLRAEAATVGDEATTAAVLGARAGEAVRPVYLALQLHGAALESVRSYPIPDDGGLYASREPFLLFTRGRSVEQVYRRFDNSPEMTEYLALRGSVLLYE